MTDALRKAWSLGMLAFADEIAHFLYCPAMGFTRSARSSWRTRIHLIPGWALAFVCDRWEAHLQATSPDWIDDESITLEQANRMFEHLGPELTIGPPSNTWTCPHLTLSVSGGRAVGPPKTWCGCTMIEVPHPAGTPGDPL